MFKNYLTTALRNLLRHKLYSVINIGGLAIGLAACILILLFVQDELSYDDWIPDAERVFKIELTIPIPGRETLMLGQVPPGIAPVMENYFPDHIEDSTRVLQVESIIGADERYFNDVISYVDDGFFNVFDLEIVAGSRDPIATSVRDILISETVARKHFGEQNPVGRVVSATVMRNFFSNMNPNSEYRVAGVFRDIPSNSHLPFQALALLDPDRFEGINEGFGGAWLDAAYFKFFPGVDPLELESRLGGFYSNVAPPRGDESEAYDYRVDRKFNFINVADVHLHSDKIQQLKPIGDFNTVISFAIAAVLILVIAAINFMNAAGQGSVAAQGARRQSAPAGSPVHGRGRPDFTGRPDRCPDRGRIDSALVQPVPGQGHAAGRSGKSTANRRNRHCHDAGWRPGRGLSRVLPVLLSPGTRDGIEHVSQ
jgi:putative ABC transport system permease protein